MISNQIEEKNYLEPIKPIITYHGHIRENANPYRAFRNWLKFFRLPWFCFIDLAVVLLYLIFALLHEKSAVAFTLDLSQAIDKFFISDLEISEAPTGIPIGNGRIFCIDEFINVVDLISQRLYDFPLTIPILHPILRSSNINLLIKMYNGQIIHKDVDQSQANETSSLILPYLDEFSTVSLSMTYHIMFASEKQDARLNLEIIARFIHDPRTDTVHIQISHNRFQEKFKITLTILFDTFDYSMPFTIIILNAISIFTTIHNLRMLIFYTREKSAKIGLTSFLIFRKKFDRWDIFSFLSHSISIATCIAYFFVGQDIEEELPPIYYFLSVATCFHSLLLIRYLRLKSAIMMVTSVLYSSLIAILKFILGCLPIFIGFWGFGICFWGHLTSEFGSPLQAAIILFCVMHGDSILGFYDATIIQNDYTPYLGFFYSSFWIAFSLLLMFNITISIVSDVWDMESLKMKNKETHSELYIGMLTTDLSKVKSKANPPQDEE